MGDTIRIEPGSRPWSPGYESELVEELARFDVPTVGILWQEGNHYAFWCVEGWNDPKSLWAYILLEDDDVEELRDVDSAGAGYQKLAELATSKPVTVALADEREGVVLLSTLAQIEPKDFGSAAEVARQVVEDAYWAFESHLDHLRHQVRRSHRTDSRRAAAVS